MLTVWTQESCFRCLKSFSILINSNFNFSPNLEHFKNIYNEIKLGGLCYNHSLKSYCQVDLYDDINIVEIWTENSSKKISKEKFIELVIKLIISNKTFKNSEEKLCFF